MKKTTYFLKCWVRLAPGHDFQLQVPPELHQRLRVGRRLRLTYTAQGEQISVVELT